jgi:hypothetical protein
MTPVVGSYAFLHLRRYQEHVYRKINFLKNFDLWPTCELPMTPVIGSYAFSHIGGTRNMFIEK